METQDEYESADLGCFEGIIVDHPHRRKLIDGSACSMFSIKPLSPVGTSLYAQNSIWPVVIYRQSSVGTMMAAEPGDIVEIHGRVQNSQIIVPKNDGRVSYLVTE